MLLQRAGAQRAGQQHHRASHACHESRQRRARTPDGRSEGAGKTLHADVDEEDSHSPNIRMLSRAMNLSEPAYQGEGDWNGYSCRPAVFSEEDHDRNLSPRLQPHRQRKGHPQIEHRAGGEVFVAICVGVKW